MNVQSEGGEFIETVDTADENAFSEADVAVTAPAAYNLDEIAIPQIAPQARAGGGGQGASIMMINPNDGSQVARNVYMQALAKAGWSRQQILAHVKQVTGDENLRYQTVYQATKDYFTVKPRTSVVLGLPADESQEG